MFQWICPLCQKKMHSSSSSFNEKTVVCVNCNKEMTNIYYRENGKIYNSEVNNEIFSDEKKR